MRLGSIHRRGEAHLALVFGNRVLSLTELGKREAGTYGLFRESRDVSPLWTEEGRRLVQLIHDGLRNGISTDWEPMCEGLDGCTWLPPVAAPQKIICIGLNYRDHAAESKMDIPKEPVIFNKFNNALVGAAGPIILPKNSQQVDYEAELAVVVGRRAKRVTVDEAVEYVGGYTLMHDVSARDWQFRTGQWISGKTFDSFGPCGPYLVTPDEISDPHNLSIQLTLNGRVMQRSNTRELIFNIPALVSYLSHMFTLEPGDIISTGTPPGVGFVRKPPVFLKDGDVVEISVEQVGTMRHHCVAEE